MMLQVIIEVEHKSKMVDFLLDFGLEDFYSFGLQQYLSKELLLDDKEKVDGYRECICFMLLLDNGKKKLKKALRENFNTVRIVESKIDKA